MAMTADKLKVYFASKILTADAQAIPQLTADAGGSTTTIKDAALTQGDDYWNGSVGVFNGDTTTAALRGLFFHVKDFDAATDVLTLSKTLPTAPVAGDTYRLILGGSWRSSLETFGMTADGDQPELVSVPGVNITGITIKKLSGALLEQVLTLTFDFTNLVLYAHVGAEADGVGLDVSGNLTDANVYTADGLAFVRVDVVTASLPGSDQVDTWTLAYPERTLTPDIEGYEARDPKGGKTRYRLEVVKNTGAVDMLTLAATVAKPSGVETTIASGSLGLGAGSFNLASASGWPTGGFWVRNKTKDDCRYVDFRSGVALNCFAVDWALVPFDTGTGAAILPGDFVEGATSSASGYVDQVVLTSGTWGVDAAGTLLVKRIVGTFTNNENIQVSAVTRALANGASVKGLRGKTAQSWAATDVVVPMCDADIGLDSPSTLQFEDPTAETDAPAGVTFVAADSADLALAIGTLAAGNIYGVWRREWIEYNHQPRSGINMDTLYAWA